MFDFNIRQKEDYYVISMLDTLESYFFYQNPRFACEPEIVDIVPLPQGQERVRYLRPLFVKKQGDDLLVCIASYMESSYLGSELLRMGIVGASNNLISHEYLLGMQDTAYQPTDTLMFKESFIVFKSVAY